MNIWHLDSTRLDSTRLGSVRLACSTRLDSTRLDSTRLNLTKLISYICIIYIFTKTKSIHFHISSGLLSKLILTHCHNCTQVHVLSWYSGYLHPKIYFFYHQTTLFRPNILTFYYPVLIDYFIYSFNDKKQQSTAFVNVELHEKSERFLRNQMTNGVRGTRNCPNLLNILAMMTLLSWPHVHLVWPSCCSHMRHRDLSIHLVFICSPSVFPVNDL